jgi:hypothetical protein
MFGDEYDFAADGLQSKIKKAPDQTVANGDYRDR